MTEHTTPPAPADEVHPAAPSRRLELVTALVAAAVSAGVLLMAQGIESRVDAGGVTPRWWPTLLAGTSLGLSLLLVVTALRGGGDRGDLQAATRPGWARVVVAVALSAVFIVAWDVIGFVVACPFYLAGLVATFGGRGVKALVAFPVGVTALIYLLFVLLLRVPL